MSRRRHRSGRHDLRPVTEEEIFEATGEGGEDWRDARDRDIGAADFTAQFRERPIGAADAAGRSWHEHQRAFSDETVRRLAAGNATAQEGLIKAEGAFAEAATALAKAEADAMGRWRPRAVLTLCAASLALGGVLGFVARLLTG